MKTTAVVTKGINCSWWFWYVYQNEEIAAKGQSRSREAAEKMARRWEKKIQKEVR